MRWIVLALIVFTLATSACSLSVGPGANEKPPAAEIGWPGTPDGGAVAAGDFDRQAFAEFVGTKPTADAFRAAYPDITLVLPGGIATTDFRSDHSRFFATVDDAGHIIGGRFQ